MFFRMSVKKFFGSAVRFIGNVAREITCTGLILMTIGFMTPFWLVARIQNAIGERPAAVILMACIVFLSVMSVVG